MRAFNHLLRKLRREDIVFSLLCGKFAHDADVRERLLATGDRRNAEASPCGGLWGIGIDAFHLRAASPSQWPGQTPWGQSTHCDAHASACAPGRTPRAFAPGHLTPCSPGHLPPCAPLSMKLRPRVMGLWWMILPPRTHVARSMCKRTYPRTSRSSVAHCPYSFSRRRRFSTTVVGGTRPRFGERWRFSGLRYLFDACPRA